MHAYAVFLLKEVVGYFFAPVISLAPLRLWTLFFSK